MKNIRIFKCQYHLYLPVTRCNMCMLLPFLSSSRHPDSACGIPKVMAVDGGLWEKNTLEFS